MATGGSRNGTILGQQFVASMAVGANIVLFALPWRVRSGLEGGTKQNPMPEEIAKANIEHYKKLLETETDVEKRAVIERLMAEEELKVAAARKARAERRKG